jgi:hypothetical protein
MKLEVKKDKFNVLNISIADDDLNQWSTLRSPESNPVNNARQIIKALRDFIDREERKNG